MSCTYTRREIITLPEVDTYVHRPKFAFQNIIGFRILKIMCPNNFYNVISGVNNVFDWYGSTNILYSITIPAGQYDPYTLASTFTTLANAAQAVDVFTVTYDITTKKFTIATNNNITPQWFSGVNSAINVSSIMGYFNDTLVNETTTTSHVSDTPALLIPAHYLLKSQALAAGRKSAGGGGGTQIRSGVITHNPQHYINVLPNQVDGSVSTFAYMPRGGDIDHFTYAAPRQFDEIDLQIVHPYYPTLTDNFLSIYTPITYEIEFTCENRYK